MANRANLDRIIFNHLGNQIHEGSLTYLNLEYVKSDVYATRWKAKIVYNNVYVVIYLITSWSINAFSNYIKKDLSHLITGRYSHLGTRYVSKLSKEEIELIREISKYMIDRVIQAIDHDLGMGIRPYDLSMGIKNDLSLLQPLEKLNQHPKPWE